MAEINEDGSDEEVPKLSFSESEKENTKAEEEVEVAVVGKFFDDSTINYSDYNKVEKQLVKVVHYLRQHGK
jgi:uncharacterized beta-barrel protein YwiB (DUF1934 family)